MVHGTFKGRYTVITDEYMTYRRHAYPSNNDEITAEDLLDFCNIKSPINKINQNIRNLLNNVSLYEITN